MRVASPVPVAVVAVAALLASTGLLAILAGGLPSTVRSGNLSTAAVGPSTNLTGVPPKNWSHLFPSPAPGSRAEDVMAFDPGDGYFVMFGGHNRLNLLGDTWKYTPAGKWVHLHPTVSPQPRRGAGMVWDAADGYLLLFGGSNNTTYFNDTWEFKTGKWTQLFPTTSPPARRVPGMTYDSTNSEVVMFGGHGGSLVPPTYFHFYNDTWTFHAGTWAQLLTPVAPSPRAEPMVVYDPFDGYVLLFGGYASVPTFGDTWTLKGGVWTNITRALSTAPASRDGGAIAYDPNGSGVVLFGGHHRTHIYNDTWWFHAGAWSPVHPAIGPLAVNAVPLAWDTSANFGVLFGGRWAHGWVNSTWALSP